MNVTKAIYRVVGKILNPVQDSLPRTSGTRKGVNQNPIYPNPSLRGVTTWQSQIYLGNIFRSIQEKLNPYTSSWTSIQDLSVNQLRKARRQKRLKAVTLTEVLVAMALLGIVITFTMMISENVYKESPSLIELRAENFIDLKLNKIEATKLMLDFEELNNEFRITGEFTDREGLAELEIKVFEIHSNSLLRTEKHLFLSGE